MKKPGFIASLIFTAFMGLFTGCETTDEGPSIQFFGGAYIDDDVTVEPGGVLKFSWLATKGTSNLASFTIERDNITLAGYPDESVPNDNYKDSVNLEAPLNEGEYVYELIVTDKNDLTATGSFTITVEQTGGPINSWTATLGSYLSATGSSFASITGEVYQMDDAKTNSGLIDFLYYYGASNLAALAAPDDGDAATVFSGGNGLGTWTTRNSTKLKGTTLSATDFDGIANDLLIVANATGASGTSEHHLEVGDVVAFITDADKTGGSKMGLIKIVSITGEAAGTMQIAVKVQQ